MSEEVSVEKIIEFIESLSPSNRDLLFDELHARGMGTEPLELGNATGNIQTAESRNFWGYEGKATERVLLKNEADGSVSATLLGWPECKVYGKTRSQALQQLQELVNQQLIEGEIVSVKLKSTHLDNPWMRIAGKYKDDPLFDDFLADIEAYRHELDAETEAGDIQQDAEVGVK